MSQAPTFSDDDEERRKELLEATKERTQEHTEKHADALDKIGKDDALQTESVEIGDLEMEIKPYLSRRRREVAKTKMQSLSEDDLDIDDAADALVPLFDEITVNSEYNTEFWNAYIDEYADVGLAVAMRKLLSPVIENVEEQGAMMQSFQDDRTSENGPGNGDVE